MYLYDDCIRPATRDLGKGSQPARTPDGISTLPADGSAAPTQVSTVKGLPSYRP
ncbi:hypothetical protein ACFVUY_24065 [Kitasatospora sp. NPDC058063]|uniref:hypothetical protein n=1 Tax=unclassified Kitasatospora TaxID=2633591 RepID=UPI0036DC101D